MKKLITAEDICKSKSDKQDIYVDKNTIVTPQARDDAKKYGVKLIEVSNNCIDKTCNREDNCPIEPHKCEKEESDDKALSADEIYKLLTCALDLGIVSEKDLNKLI